MMLLESAHVDSTCGSSPRLIILAYCLLSICPLYLTIQFVQNMLLNQGNYDAHVITHTCTS